MLSATTSCRPTSRPDELRHQRAVVNRIGKYFASFGYSSSWHIIVEYFARLALFWPLWAAWRHTSSVPACDRQRRPSRACRESRDSARRQILHAAASNKHNRVLLQVVTDAGNVGRHLDPVGQANARDFAQRRVRFLRRLRVNARANTTLLRRTLERGTGRLVLDLLAAFANKLIYRRHCFPLNTWRV
jgi:hypothetical protein